MTPARTQSAVKAEVEPRTPIEERLAASGLPCVPRTAWLEIDLAQIVANYRALHDAVPEGTELRAVVKADAYGHGAVPVAKALEASGADGLCVAELDEAAELRAAGITLPILVLYPLPPALAVEASRLDVAITAGDATLLARLVAAVRAAHESGELERPVRVHLETDTGLGRVGFLPDEVPAAAQLLLATPGIELAGLWSHLQAAESDERTAAQAEAFAVASKLLEGAGIDLPNRHLAASGAILAGNTPDFDVARAGLAIYGLWPEDVTAAQRNAGVAKRIRPALRLVARPVRVVELRPGVGVGYGPSFRTSRPSRIATIPLGYGDGYRRTLSNRVPAIVRGYRVPMVGTIAMEGCAVDVTDIPGAPVSVDDEIVLIGSQGSAVIEAHELARIGGTISWEIVAALTRRLPRVYTAGGRPIGIRTLTETILPDEHLADALAGSAAVGRPRRIDG